MGGGGGGGGFNPISTVTDTAGKLNPFSGGNIKGVNPFQQKMSNNIGGDVAGTLGGSLKGLFPEEPRPEIAGRNSMLSGGRLTGDAYLDASKLQGNTGALDVLNQKATATGDSPWLKMQLQKQRMEQRQAMGKAGAQTNAATATARANLATKGGLSGGAAERLARGGAADLNAARQGIGATGATNRMNLGIQDETTKNQLLGQAVGANANQNAQNIGMAQFNATNTLAENNANNAYAMQKYQEQMKGYGANKTANALAQGGKK